MFEAKFVALNVVLGALCVLCVVVWFGIYVILAFNYVVLLFYS